MLTIPHRTLSVLKKTVMWWMLSSSFRSTHQVAVWLLCDTAHWPPLYNRSDFRPSTALLASNVSLPSIGYSWCAGLLSAILTVDKTVFKNSHSVYRLIYYPLLILVAKGIYHWLCVCPRPKRKFMLRFKLTGFFKIINNFIYVYDNELIGFNDIVFNFLFKISHLCSIWYTSNVL